jgi:hypothetical protein
MAPQPGEESGCAAASSLPCGRQLDHTRFVTRNTPAGKRRRPVTPHPSLMPARSSGTGGLLARI